MTSAGASEIKLLGTGAHPFRYLACETVVKPDVAAFIPAKFVETLPQGERKYFAKGSRSSG